MTLTSSALDGLLYLRNGYPAARWNFPYAVGSPVNAPAGIGRAVSLTYSFLGSLPAYSPDSGFLAFDDLQKQTTRSLLSALQELVHVVPLEVAGVGQLAFGQSAQPGGQGGYAYSPAFSYTYAQTIRSVTEIAAGGDVWLNRNAGWSADDWTAGHGGHGTLLHEIGHALGLKHSFEGTWTLDPSLDDMSHTVMSYTPAPHSTLITVSGTATSYAWVSRALEPATWMPLDIEALQYLYGANTATRAGNDVYRWATNAELLETIWDGGGTDTIDCTNQIFTCIVDLRAGHYSSIGLRQTEVEKRLGLELPAWFAAALPADVYDGSHNLAIAKRVLIETALSGSGNDQLIGNEAANVLSGAGGQDKLSGGGGNDRLDGGAGNDQLDGGAGDDSMEGGDGNDSYYVRDAGDVVVETGASASASLGGTDTVYSYLAAYTLGSNVEYGRIMSAGSASLTGNAASNLLYAGAGDNLLSGGSGSEADTVSYLYAAAGVTVSLAVAGAQNTGGSGTDTLVRIEHLRGSSFNDTLGGGPGNNVLTGGLGRDLLAGNGGNDTFDFNSLAEMGNVTDGASWDVIGDFGPGDRIDLSGLDANTLPGGGNEAFSGSLVSAFTPLASATAAGQLMLAAGVLYGNTDADVQPEFALRLTGVSSLSATAFVL